MQDQPEQPTPDSLNLWVELQAVFQDTAPASEWQEFLAAKCEVDAMRKRDEETGKRVAVILSTMRERVSHRFDITAQASELRFEFREAALLSKQAIHVDARMSRALTAVEEKLSTIINDK